MYATSVVVFPDCRGSLHIVKRFLCIVPTISFWNGNKLKETKLELVDAATGDIIKDNAGTYSTGTGEVKLVGVEINGYTGDKIKVSATPNDQSTIKPLRNYILKIDTDKSASTATVDFQNTSTSLST